jgi:hypothetical protein
MSEDRAGVSEAEGDDRDAVRAVLSPFARRYLHELSAQSRSTKPWRSWYWRRHPGLPNTFEPLDMLLPVADCDQWDEYKALEAVARTRPRLLRLITKPMYGPSEPVPELAGLLHGVVLLAIERYQALHDTDEEEFPDLIEELTDWFCREADPIFVAVSVIGFTASEPLTLAPGITVRRATDVEVSAMLQMGALDVVSNPTPTQVYSTHVPEEAQWIVAMDHARPRRFGLDVQDGDEPDLSALKDKADNWLAVLRILTPSQVRLGSILKTQLVGGMAAGGSVDRYGASALFAWHHPAVVTPDKVATFEALAQRILSGRSKELGVAHGLHRFSEATTRTSAADRLVDLVISLESLFSEDADSVSYKVSRRASSMVGPLGLSAGTVYRFVKAAYTSRSDIVHGRVPRHRNLVGEKCPVEDQVRELDRLVASIFRQVLSSSSIEKPHETAEKLIDAALDSPTHSATSGDSTRYDATVRHDGNTFTAVLPVDDTFLVRGLTVEQLHTHLADAVALWTQAPCEQHQIDLELDDDARAANEARS